MGSRATKCVASQVSHDDPAVRAVAAELIGYMGKGGEEHVDVVAKLVRDDAAIARRYAVHALGALGKAGQVKAAEVARCLKDPDTDVRRMAVDALRRMEKAGWEHMQGVVELLKDPEWTVRRSAVEAVGSMGAAGAATGPYSEELAGLLNDEEWLVRGAAAEALGRVGDSAVAHCGGIQPLLCDKEWFVRNVAAEALHSLGPQGQVFLEIHHEGMRSSAAEMLATRLNPVKAKFAAVEELPDLDKSKKKGDGRRGNQRAGARHATKAAFHHRQTQANDQMAQAIYAHQKKTIMDSARAKQDVKGALYYDGFDPI
eukprot:gnl/MRDRNA2_/MRDRNA2_281106_c0_seq1.p1 gnl/MRDRNA2_/MRDRNA2_281106_c0~~gnl/MRDRNA2_/MRDRNA2_281106_c0_seq1.p1  ORF type:complete len:330 (+),score=85.44 gnl/MRDRNA2_/MRDRNA2_281106_c0_seq1:50-991(+)